MNEGWNKAKKGSVTWRISNNRQVLSGFFSNARRRLQQLSGKLEISLVDQICQEKKNETVDNSQN